MYTGGIGPMGPSYPAQSQAPQPQQTAYPGQQYPASEPYGHGQQQPAFPAPFGATQPFGQQSQFQTQPSPQSYGMGQGGGGGVGGIGQNISQSHQYAMAEWPSYQGNSSVIKPVFGTFPANKNTQKKMSMPLTVYCKPLGRLLDPETGAEIPCPVVDVPQGGSIVRCTAPNCRAYVNAFALWLEEGRRWRCPNCHRVNDLIARSKEYFIGRVDEYQRRVDRYERPELHSGTMEFVAPQEYTMRPPMRPSFCFLIDVTKSSVQKGVVDAVCHAIKEAIKAMPTQTGESHERAQIMIGTFDSDTHIYQLPRRLEDGSWSQPTVLTHPGASDPYALTSHLDDSVVMDVQENKAAICQLLDVIPTIWRTQMETRSALGAALKEMELYLSKIGGRVLAFAASRPQIGEVNTVVSPDGERMQAKSEAMLKPANNAWRKLGTNMAQDKEAHCPMGVELYAFSPSHQETPLDLPTLIGLPAASGHNLYQFDASSYETIDHTRLMQAVKWSCVDSNIAWESCVRVRVSKGWRISNDMEGWNNFENQEIRDSLVSYPALGEDGSISFNLDLVEAKEHGHVFNDTHVHVQVALLYTTTGGSRRIRLNSIALPVSSNLAEIWGSISPMNVFQQLAYVTLRNAKQNQMKAMDYLHTRLDQILQAMRVAQYPHADHVIRDLATYAFGFTKTDALREIRSAQEMTPDTRVVMWYTYSRMFSPTELLQQTYPHHQAPEEIEQFVQRVLQGRGGGAMGGGVPGAMANNMMGGMPGGMHPIR